mgnify:CR=1 FL=1
MEQKILFTLEAKDRGLNAQLTDAREQVRRLSAELRKTKDGSDEYKRLTGEVGRAKDEVSKLAKEQRQFTRDMEAMKAPKDSLIGLRNEYSKLSAQIAQLSEAERKGSFGKALIRNAKSVKSEIDGIEQSIGRFTGNVGNYKSAVAGLSRVLGGLGIAFGIDSIVSNTREYEKLFAVLDNAVGSTAKAKLLFSEIQEFAKETPFQLAEVANGFVKLEQRNFNPTINDLRTLGDISSASGKSINQFIEAILDAQTFEFERLKEFGIVVRKEGDNLKATFRGQTTVLERSDEAVKAYLLSLGKLPGIQGAASAVAKTLDGSISNLLDNFAQLFSTIGSGGGVLKGVVDLFGSLVSAANDLLSTPVSEEIRNQQVQFNALIGVLQDTNTEESARGEIIATLKREYPDYLKFVNDDKNGQIDLAKTLEAGNRLFEQRIFLQATAEEREALIKRRIEAERALTKALIEQKQVEQSGNAGQTVGFARNEAGELSNRPTRGQLAGAGVEGVRKTISIITGELDKLNKEADATSLRVYGKTAAELDATLNSSKSVGGTSGGGGGKKLSDEVNAASDSIEYLQKQLSKLNDEFERAPQSEWPERAKEIKAVSDALGDAQTKAEFLKSGGYGDRAPIDFLPTKQDLETALTEAQRLLDERKLKADVELQTTTGDAIKGASSDATNKSKSQQVAEGLKTEEDAAKRSIEIKEALRDASISIAEETSAALFSIRQNEIDQQLEQQLTALDAQTEARIKAAGNDQTAIDAIKADSDKKRLALEAEAARKRKELAIKEALINTALAVTKALTGAPPPFNAILAAASLASGLAQVAVIRKQQFAKGGKVIPVSGPSHAGGGVQGSLSDGTQFEVEGGEQLYVLKKNDKQSIAALSDENVRRGGVSFFADTTPGAGFGTIPQRVLPGQTAAQGRQAIDVSMSDENIEMFANVVAARVAETAGQKVKDGVVTGLDSANRLREREAEMQEKRAL